MPEESTTHDLVELTRRQFAFADSADWDAILETYARDAVWELRQGATFEGADAIRELWVDYFSAYEEFEIETEEILDFGNGVILAVNEQKARLVGSASHIQTREAFVYTWDRGVVVRVTMYTDIDKAHAAAERLAEERGVGGVAGERGDRADARQNEAQQERREMQARIDVITLAVADLERAFDFYRDGLGLQSSGVVGTEFVGDDVNPAGAIAMFELRGGLILSLYPRAELAKDAKVSLGPPKTGEFSIGHAVASKPEVDALVIQAEAAGATVTDRPHDRPWGIYSGYFRDPDGHLWEVLWNPRLLAE